MRCANLNINFGSKQLIFASGDGFGRRTVTVDVTAEASFDNYPFDSYTAVGIVKVWHTASWHRACVQMDVPCLAFMVPCCTGIRIRVGVGTGMMPPCQHGPALVGVGCVIDPRMTAPGM